MTFYSSWKSHQEIGLSSFENLSLAPTPVAEVVASFAVMLNKFQIWSLGDPIRGTVPMHIVFLLVFLLKPIFVLLLLKHNVG